MRLPRPTVRGWLHRGQEAWKFWHEAYQLPAEPGGAFWLPTVIDEMVQVTGEIQYA
jgi:hypothetical protein